MEISSMNIQNNSFDYAYPKKVSDSENKRAQSLSPADNSIFEKPQDRYIPHEKDKNTVQGIYKMASDKSGKPKLIFEAPKNAVVKKSPKKSETSQCMGSTDKVDSEIKRLKKQKQQIERRMSNATNEEAEKLRQQLDQIERELMQKDNDSYRRQHTVFTQR